VALVRLWDESYGREKLLPLLEALSSRAGLFIRVNTLKTDDEKLLKQLEEEGCTAVLCDFVPHCIRIDRLPGKITDLPFFEQGLFHVQDTASQLLCSFVAPQPGTITADVCAAPGGKSFAAAIAMEGTGSITSCDFYEHKAKLIANGAQRLGLTNITALQQDATVQNPEWVESMDAVIADVPCSGYGIIRKKPDIRYKNPKDMEDLPDLQLKILCNQADYVVPGGVLIYSTCTLLRRENEDVVKAFLTQRPDYTLEPLPLPAALPKNESGMLTLVPGEFDTDGFFISRLRRKQ
jgi:16S rRNA (cytosine967-C5)-methyltransferase